MALLLLVLALLGATPRQYLHDVVADHVDVNYGFRGKACTVAPVSYNCGFHHQVAESPWQPEPAPVMAIPRLDWVNLFITPAYTSPTTGFGTPVDGRGPPASTFA